jgi:hypothetical protein
MDTKDGIGTEGGAGCEQAARSGPQTPQGKRRSSRNARTHGILADVLQRDGCLGDSHSDFSKLLVGLRGHFGPVGFFQNLLVEKLAIQYLRLGLVYKADLKTARVVVGPGEPLAVTSGSSCTQGRVRRSAQDGSCPRRRGGVC